MVRIGVLALQGAFAEHVALLEKLEVQAFPIRLAQDLTALDGLVIPGGESTTMLHLMKEYALGAPLKGLALDGLPMMGTCAGMVMLAKHASGLDRETLGAMDIDVKRNAFGRQVDSFETDLDIPVIGEPPFHAVFIRAPFIERAGDGVEVLAKLANGAGVAARQGKLIVLAFHPELTSDTRLHSFFVEVVRGER
jgi:5'-phosphate synthase pdxT subunit